MAKGLDDRDDLRGRGDWEPRDEPGRSRRRVRGGRLRVARSTGEHSFAEVLQALRDQGFARPARAEHDEGRYRVEGVDEAGRPFLVVCDAATLAVERLR